MEENHPPDPTTSRSTDSAVATRVHIPAGLRGLLWLSGCANLCWLWLHRTQPDWATALTVIPAWCCLLGATALLLALRIAIRTPAWWFGAAMTVLFALLSVEQTRSLARGPFRLPPRENHPDRPWRVVSLNCHVGTQAVIADLRRWQPDVVLLQESPSQVALTQIARELFGETGAFVTTGDCSIVAEGELELVPGRTGDRFVEARWRPISGPEVRLYSLRLTPPPTRLDLWRPECWQAHRMRRETHRRQLGELIDSLGAVPSETPVIVAGDFNSPAGDAAHRPLTDRLRDGYLTSGRGWGQTFSSRFPFHRIDQIWLSPQLRPLRSGAMVTEHSDHRAAICDLLRPEGAR